MSEQKPIIVNLIASPGSGKSTSAAAIFAYLKNKDCNVEVISEYAKRVVYRQSPHQLSNQFYVSGKQYEALKSTIDYGVRLVITDAPLVLGKIYSKTAPYHKQLCALIDSVNEEFENVNVFIKRVKKYNPSGRLQTEAQSDLLANELRGLVEFDYVIEGKPEDQQLLAEQLYMKYGSRIEV